MYLTSFLIELLLTGVNGFLLYRIDIEDASNKAHELID